MEVEGKSPLTYAGRYQVRNKGSSNGSADFLSRLPQPATDLDRTSTAPDPTASPAPTPSASTSSKPAVSLQSRRSPRALAWMGSSRLPLAAPTPFPVPLHKQRFRRLPSLRTTYGHLALIPAYSAIRGRYRCPKPRRLIASRSSLRPPLYSSPRRRIASQPSPRPPFCPSLTADSLRRVFVGPPYDQDPAEVSPHGVPAGPCFIQDQNPAASPHGVPPAHALFKTKTPLQHRFTAFPPANALSKTKTPPWHRLTTLPSANELSKTKTPPPHRRTAFPPAHALSKTSPSPHLAAFLSATSLISTTSPNRLPAPRKSPWSLTFLPVWLPGHPSSPHRLPRVSRFRSFLVPRQA